MIIFIDTTKQLIVWESTTVLDEHQEEAHEKGSPKYQMVEQCRSQGWQVL